MSPNLIFYCLLETFEPCTYKTTIKANLMRHISSVHYSDEKTLICSTCYKSFSRKDNLKTHIINTHQNKITYSCKTCLKTYRRYDFFERHEESCKGTKIKHSAGNIVKEEKKNPLICVTCSKYYQRADFYETHIKNCYNKQLFNHENTSIHHITWDVSNLCVTLSYEL